MTPIFRFFDLFLPPNLRNNPTDLMRGYIMIGLILVNIVICGIVLIQCMFFLQLEHNQAIAIAIVGLCLLGYLSALLLLIWTENYILCANYMITILALAVVLGIQITGGYLESPISKLGLQLPVTAFLLMGLRQGLAWLGITLLFSAGLYISAVSGFGYIQLLQSQTLVQTMDISMLFILLLIIGAALTVYEMINGLLTRQLREERNRFEHKASHDDLTGLPNRFEFFRRLKSAIEDAQERRHKVGIVYLDLDGFKPINDLMGHHVGDEALTIVAKRLRLSLRLSDTAARLGGDEFALIIPGIHVPVDIQNILPKVLEAVRQPMNINGVDVVVKASCGVAIYPVHAEDDSALCRYADMAMYRAKEKSDTWVMFNSSMKSGAPA
ncbi:MAG: GGDEF domain-containing protein [Halioglobus sp.]|nr:GGDEF domain-containing protein [Halioglobus sp.]